MCAPEADRLLCVFQAPHVSHSEEEEAKYIELMVINDHLMVSRGWAGPSAERLNPGHASGHTPFQQIILHIDKFDPVSVVFLLLLSIRSVVFPSSV